MANAPVTIWRNQTNQNEFDSEDPNDIVDASTVYLVDPSGVQIVDTGVTETSMPATVWAEDNSI